MHLVFYPQDINCSQFARFQFTTQINGGTETHFVCTTAAAQPVVPVVNGHNTVFQNKSIPGFLSLANILNNSFRLLIFPVVELLKSADSAELY